MSHYQFIDHWYINAPIEQVFRHVADASSYPRWWPVYPQVEVLKTGDANGIGGCTRLVVKSALGYTLNLEVTTVEANAPTYLKTVTRGQLEGTGVWQFEQQGPTTHATWTWIVNSNHPLLNLLEPIAKPLFRWSHNDASAKGHRGLKHLLENPM